MYTYFKPHFLVFCQPVKVSRQFANTVGIKTIQWERNFREYKVAIRMSTLLTEALQINTKIRTKTHCTANIL